MSMDAKTGYEDIRYEVEAGRARMNRVWHSSFSCGK